MSSKKILGESKAVADLVRMIEKVAPAKTSVLIIGESGTGKELVARMIHDIGPMRGQAFIPVNCGAIPENLIESELFGHKKGSFTGAIADKIGLFEAADGGTLFLDEVGELPLGMQVKLLRALQDRTVRRVGSNDDLKIDVRIIAATNRNLEEAVKNGSFREDLYYRLNVILIKTPALRDRDGDVQLLADAFLKKFSEKQNRKIRGFSADSLAAIQAYRWPGNVRELENTIERVVTLETGDEISLGSFPSSVRDAVANNAAKKAIASQLTPAGLIEIPGPDFSGGPVALDEILGKVERAYLEAALEKAKGVRKEAAQLLGITFRSIRYRLKKLGVDPSDGDSEDDGE